MTVPIFHHPPFGGAFDGAFNGAFSQTGGFSPAFISNLVLWLDANEGVILDTPPNVKDWEDQSGNDNDAAQATSNQPSLAPTDLNGRPTLAFDSANQERMVVTSSSSISLSSSFTAYCVCNPFTVAFITLFSKNGNAGFRWILQTPGLNPRILLTGDPSGTTFSDLTSPTGIATAEDAILELHYQIPSPKRVSFTNKGVSLGQRTTTVDSINTNAAGLFIGKTDALNQDFNGEIAQILIYDRLLTTVERNKVGNYLAGRYGLTWTDIPFAPSDLTGLVLWLDAAQGVTETGNQVSEWKDQSGNDNDAVQTTENDKPSFEAAGFNGVETIFFDASNTEDMDIADANSLDLTGDFTAYCVCEPISFVDATIFHKNTSVYKWQLSVNASNGNQKVLTEGTGPLITSMESTTNAITPATRVVLEVVHEIGGVTKFCRFTKSGVSMGDIFPTGANILTSTLQMFVGSAGGSEYFDGDISQVLLFNRLLTVTERNEVGNYLAGRHGLTWTDVVAPPFIPTDLSGLVGWWDADFGITLGVSPDVAFWKDRSGNDNEVGQGLTDFRPHFNSTGINGRASLTFNGSNNELLIADAATTGLNFTGSFTAYVVAKNTDFGNFRTMFGKGGNKFRFLYAQTGGAARAIVGQDTGDIGSTTVDDEIIMELHWDVSIGGLINFTKSGVPFDDPVVSTISTIVRDTQTFSIGQAFGTESHIQFFQGEIGQVLLFDRLLTTIERNQVGNYLAGRYGLTWTDVT